MDAIEEGGEGVEDKQVRRRRAAVDREKDGTETERKGS